MNNIKLYTEEQVKRAMLDSYLSGVERPADYLPIEESILNSLTPIELPSDDEIEGKKKSSIEWLRDKLFNEFGFAFSDNIFEQSKQLHRQEIMDAVDYGCSGYGSQKDAEQYYKETYETDN